MQRDELDRHIANNGRTEIDIYEEPPGEWVRLADSKPAGLTPRGQQMPDTKKEWKYMAELYAQQIEADKLTIAQLKQRINKLEQKR